MIFISLGSNLGNRLFHLQEATRLLEQSGFKIYKQSIVIETAALVPEHAPQSWNLPYLNMMLAGETSLEPQAVIATIKEIEQQVGRAKLYEKWAPRIIDIDIVLWDEKSIKDVNLTVPHPELNNRDFWQYLLNTLGHPNYKFCQMPTILSTKKIAPKLMGILNITQDSFSDGGSYINPQLTAKQATAMHLAGASALDLGAQSTRPGAVMLSAAQELAALAPVLDKISHDKNLEGVQLSIDTFRPEVALTLAKKYPISWINDVSGSLNDNTLQQLKRLGCGICAMHALSIPADPNNIFTSDTDLMPVLEHWAAEKLEQLLELGFDKKNIILDPGIGFGKNSKHSLTILQNIMNLKNLQVPILIGHSRKSFINQFNQISDPKNRDYETIAIALALQNKVDWLRVHAVAEHMRSMVAYAAVNN